MINNEEETSAKEFFDLSTTIIKDDSPEGEYEAVRLSQARSSLYLDMPFFGFILANLEIYPTTDPNIPTYACDTRRIYINPHFTTSLVKEHLKGILMHLVVHLIMQHGDRRSDRNLDLWGISSDVSTRLIVKDAREKLYLTNQFASNSNSPIWEIAETENIPSHLRDRPVDNVYKILRDYAVSLTQKDKNSIDRQGELDKEVLEEILGYSGLESYCGFSYAIEQFKMASMNQKLEENRFKGILRNGMAQIRDAGNLPSAMYDMINNLLDPIVPWHVVLAQFIQKSIINDWVWTRPNKRMLGMDINLPSTIKENLNVIVAVDTSGSISLDELRDFTTETHSIISSISSVKMTIIDCDAAVQQVVEIENGQSIDGAELPWEGRPWKGRGGTSFTPVFDLVEDKGDIPDLLIYFTDGYGDFPNFEPGYPVLWVMTTDIEPPFGQLIRYISEDRK